MKMWKLLCYDIKYGCIKNLKLLLFPIIFEMAVLYMLWQKINSYAQYGISTQKHMGDVLLYNFGGMEKYKLSMENVFQFPVTWMLLFVMILFPYQRFKSSFILYIMIKEVGLFVK